MSYPLEYRSMNSDCTCGPLRVYPCPRHAPGLFIAGWDDEPEALGPHESHLAATPREDQWDAPATTEGADTVLVARCGNEIEQPDLSAVRCTGELRFHWGETQSACMTCGAWCGIAVAQWLRVDPVVTARGADELPGVRLSRESINRHRSGSGTVPASEGDGQ